MDSGLERCLCGANRVRDDTGHATQGHDQITLAPAAKVRVTVLLKRRDSIRKAQVST